MVKFDVSLSLDDLGNNCFNLIDPLNLYIKSYPNLLKATSFLIKEMKSDSLVAIAHLAYGWMPTILKKIDISAHNNNYFLTAATVSSYKEANNFLYNLEKPPINNSWVGTSKVLHFINPHFFPIWDSKVGKHFEITSYLKLKDKNNFMNYINFVEIHSEDNIVLKVQKEFKKRTKYNVTKTRACEFILFSS
tara:strand:- start:1064 stop:1636 length:573 start_codon:yes stop_codon:yes gene_type:complete